jgi:hypothetical protein
MKITTKQRRELTELVNGTDIQELDILYHFSNMSDLNEDTFLDYLMERISENQVIYYNVAIEYLAHNDASLNRSMEIASDLGFEVKNINSELLATVLLNEEMGDTLSDNWSEIVEILELE